MRVLPPSRQNCRVLPPLLLAATALWLLGAGGPASAPTALDRPPHLDPDYTDLVIPPNLAPLNFRLLEKGGAAVVKAWGQAGPPIEVRVRNDQVRWPLVRWRSLLQANAGGEIYFDVRQQQTNGLWLRFLTVTNQVSPEPIDSHLVTRQLNWQFSMYGSGTIGIYQRDLTSFKETEILHLQQREVHGPSCMNCHTFLQNRPEPMALHLRLEEQGRKPMLLFKDGSVSTVEKPGGLLAWHPSGEILTLSQNRFVMIFHTLGRNRDVYDGAGDIHYYDLVQGQHHSTPATSRPDIWETWPTWSPDGKYLYFCSTPQSDRQQFMEIQYDLNRVSFDLASRTWGEVETVLSARSTGLSMAQPRISPDGRFLMFCMFPYGSFPGTQPASDLYLLDLQSRHYRRMNEVSSLRSESWHCWSSSGRWFVFSSKRRDGLLTRPYLSYFDATGMARKPFIVPQQDPAAYDSYPKLYNLPELVTGPVPVSKRELFQATFRPSSRTAPPPSAPAAAPDSTPLRAPPTE